MLDYSKSISDKVQIQNKEYVNIYLRSDSESNFYKKESCDFLQYLGDLGGLIDIVLLLGTFLTSFLSNKGYISALIGQAYLVQEYYRNFNEYYQTSQHEKISTESNS